MPPRDRQATLEIRAEREARFVLTPEASFFVPGAIPASPLDGRRRHFVLASMRGQFLGRPIITIPPEEAG